MQCDKCGLLSNPMKSVDLSGYSSKQHKIAIIRDNPDLSETANGIFYEKDGVECYGSPKTAIIVKALNQLGYNKDDILFTYVCKCAYYTDRPPSFSELNCCKERLYQELKDAGVEKCLLLGINTAKAFKNDSLLSESKTVGIPFFHEETNTWCIPTYDPGKALHFPDTFTDIVYSIKKLDWSKYDLKTKVKERIVIDKAELFPFHIIQQLYDYTKLTLDIETNTLNRYDPKAKLLSLCISTPDNYCVEIDGKLFEYDYVKKNIQSLFYSVPYWIGHTAIKFDAPFLRVVNGLNVDITDDIAVKHYIYDGRPNIHKLDQITQSFLGIPSWKHMAKDYIIDDGATYENIPKDVLFEYNILDNIYTTKDNEILDKELVGREALVKRHHDITKATVTMDDNGILVDRDYLWKLGAEWELKGEEILQEIRKLTGIVNFNPNSPKQVADYLYKTLALKPIQGQVNTKKETLEALDEEYDNPILHNIVEYRHVKHIKGTFIEGILRDIDVDGRLRSILNTITTVSGRLSSKYHNIPKRLGNAITLGFIASPGNVLINADYSTLEMRIAAWESKDEKLIEIFEKDLDIHTANAALIFNVPYEEVTKEQRFVAKTINFAVGYGMMKKALAKKLSKELKKEVTPDQAEEYINLYYDTKPQYRDFTLDVKEFVRKNQYVQTPEPYGRIRRFPLRTRANWSEIEREAVNHMVQSVASDICNNAIVKLDNRIKAASDYMKDVKLLFTIHDSILLECPEKDVHEVMKVVKAVMEDEPTINSVTKLKVDIEYGPKWGELIKAEEDE